VSWLFTTRGDVLSPIARTVNPPSSRAQNQPCGVSRSAGRAGYREYRNRTLNASPRLRTLSNFNTARSALPYSRISALASSTASWEPCPASSHSGQYAQRGSITAEDTGDVLESFTAALAVDQGWRDPAGYPLCRRGVKHRPSGSAVSRLAVDHRIHYCRAATPKEQVRLPAVHKGILLCQFG